MLLPLVKGSRKSTVTANLAVTLAKWDLVLVYADIYGPSMPIMFDVENENQFL
jgi:ATP-binding protein involved in chromosome partitioning